MISSIFSSLLADPTLLKNSESNRGQPVLYGVRGVSQIKFTMSDSFLVFYDFDILSMIKRKNPFRFYCVILILNLSRLISPITILICKSLSRLISQMHF